MSGPGVPGAPAPLRVLLLDDDVFMLDVLADMLGQLGGYAVEAESDARRALLGLARYAPDLMICDLSLPDMDGIEFMHAAACAGFHGAVMLLSGMDSGVRQAAEHLARAHGLRVIGAYKKPITLAQLDGALLPLRQGRAGVHENSNNLTPYSGK